ncbi:MAG: UvrD-helicase domain-containing protein [Ilumatobacter sp.]|uniref:ATP-dependent helicase n=2 Tax=Ilumatobacter sp. TaxID=1967498 RepID=UPI0032969D73
MDADALIADLDLDQRAAVTTESHLVAVIAGAGAGKTRVLTRRIAHRIATGDADARHTLALTFTREAAGELRRRLHRLGLRDHVEAGTFHSVMLSVLRQRWTDTERRPKTLVSDRRRLIRDAQRDDDIAGGRQLVEVGNEEISWAMARGIPSERYAALARRAGRRPAGGIDAAGAVFASYERLKRSRGVIDFDDVLLDVLHDAERDVEFADALRWRFRHLLVDEAQDLNPVQHRLIDVLRAGRDDVFLVGDPAQAVYGFNGADPALLVQVETKFPGVEVIRLPVNHRCTPQIVRAGAHVLSEGGQPTEIRSARDDGRSVEVASSPDEHTEAAMIATRIAQDDPNLIRAGNVAVLVRTNAQLDVVESALIERGMSVRRSANASNSPLQAAMRVASSSTSASGLRAWAHDTLDDIASLRAAEAKLADLEQHAVESRRSSAASRRPPAALSTRMAEARAEVARTEADRRVATTLLDFLRDQPRGDGAEFRSWVATTNPFDDRSTDGVELLTFHAAKGREWHTVFVAGVETSLMPHKSATTSTERAEEARLLYVATTRATDRLVFSFAERRAGYARQISPYLASIDVSTPEPVAPPAGLRRGRQSGDLVLERLTEWRAGAARRVRVVPAQILSDRDLNKLAVARPKSAEEIDEITEIGLLTARRLAPDVLPIVDPSSGRSVRDDVARLGVETDS